MINQFNAAAPAHFSSAEEDQLIEVTSDSILRLRFITQTVSEFWIVLPFATPYLCEMGFPAVASLKTNYISNLNIGHDLSVVVSSLQPHFEKMYRAKNVHWSCFIPIICICSFFLHLLNFIVIVK